MEQGDGHNIVEMNSDNNNIAQSTHALRLDQGQGIWYILLIRLHDNPTSMQAWRTGQLPHFLQNLGSGVDLVLALMIRDADVGS
jgi:hypothetical protein